MSEIIMDYEKKNKRIAQNSLLIAYIEMLFFFVFSHLTGFAKSYVKDFLLVVLLSTNSHMTIKDTRR